MTERIVFFLLIVTAFVRADDAGPRFFSARAGALVGAKARLAEGDKTLQPALRALVERADKALKIMPHSVTQKTKPAPSGNVHDYASTAPYFWPDPAKPDGLPYIAHDGKVNPESRTAASDLRRIELMSGTVDTLALAYYFRLNLRGLATLATLAERVGVELWHYQTADGRSIRKVLDFMLPYVKTPPEK